jgi:hydrogenase-4 component B
MHLSALTAIQGAMLLLAAGALAVLPLCGNRRLAGWFTFALTAVAGCLGLWAAAYTIAHGASEPVSYAALSLWGSTLRFSLDGLAAIFVGLVSVVAFLSALYSISYMDHYQDYHLARYYPWFLLFVAGMYGIVTVTDTMVFFCLFWQLMTIPSFALIRFEYRKASNVRAASRYLLMMELACVLIMAGSAVLAFSGPAAASAEGLARFDFDALRAHIALNGVSPLALMAALSCMLVGFGTKAGVWPLGLTWLPDAHPAAPSPVSALLSGVMIKTGVYGLIRTFLWLIPEPSTQGFSPSIWGGVLAAFGTITLVVGTFQALKQEQTKRLLAFHSIGQVGYIILGLGACIVLAPLGEGAAVLATVALVGALFHTVNHALFKSLLFLNAGTVLKATHTQDLNKLGGLATLMPLTAITCLVASFSIAGVPLFNGFASKWTIYSATILGGKYAGLLAVCGLFGILTSVLTLASFMKFFGLTFLSRRSDAVNQCCTPGESVEAGLLMQVPQVLLATACLALGILPAAGLLCISGALAADAQGIARALPQLVIDNGALTAGLIAGTGAARFAPFVVAGVLVVLMLAAYAFSRLGDAPRRSAEVWLCGYDKEADVHRYGAHNLYGEVKHLFGGKHR